MSRKPRGYWEDFANVEREIREFIADHGTDGVMPIVKEFEKHKRQDLVGAINRHGGIVIVAKRLGLNRLKTKKPVGYWNAFANVEHELLDFIAKRGTEGVMPTLSDLVKG